MKMKDETNRLILRVLSPVEAPMVLDFYEHYHTAFDPWEPDRSPNFYTLSYQKAVLEAEYNLCVKSSFLRYYIFLKEEPTFPIGSICFNHFIYSAFMSCTFGYKIAPPFQGYGYGYESSLHALHIIYSDYHIHRVEAYIDPLNEHSIHFIRKLGFSFEGTSYSYVKLRGLWRDHLRFSKISPI